MDPSRSIGLREVRPPRGRLALRFVLATLLAGCGDPAPSPVKEGRSAFSYDDDEIDPANLAPRKGQTRARGRR